MYSSHILKRDSKRLQHFSGIYRNIVRRNMMRPFSRPITICCHMLKTVKFFMKRFFMSKLVRVAERAQHVALRCSKQYYDFCVEILPYDLHY